MKAQITKPIEPYKRDDTLLRVRVDFTPEPSDPLYDGYQTSPINCHFFLLPLGFTQDDLDKAVQERMAGLKGYMAERAATGHGDISVDSMPVSLRSATRPPKGQGQALIPTLEKRWTPALVEQAGFVLKDREVMEAKR